MLHCYVCNLELSNYAELDLAGRGDMYTVREMEDPIDFFGIYPEEYIDSEKIAREYLADDGYMDE